MADHEQSTFNFNNTEPLPTSLIASKPSTNNSSVQSPKSTIGNALDGNESRNSHTPPSSNSHPPAPVVDGHGRILNPRSCVTCRKRKVKCDKLHPCSNCARAHIDCIFPTPGRAPRKVRKTGDGRDTELLARLRRLEGVVKGLGVDVGEDGSQISQTNGDKEGNADSMNTSLESSAADPSRTGKTRDMPQWSGNMKSGKFENKFGRLVVNEGRSRYVNNSFWANLSNEVCSTSRRRPCHLSETLILRRSRT